MNELLAKLEAGVTCLTDRNTDHNAVINDLGWSAADAGIGASLARQIGRWTLTQACLAHQILSKYRATQLGHLDLPPFSGETRRVLEPILQQAAAARAETLAATCGPDFGLQWSKAKTVNTKHGVKEVRSAAPTEAFWAAWRVQKEALKAKGWSVGNYDGQWQVSIWSTPAGYVAPKPVVETPYTLAPLTDAKGLLSYQLDPARFLTASLRSFNAGLDASDTGVGKTYTSLAAFRELGLRPLVVAPLITIPGWLRAAKHLGVEIDIVGWEKVRCGRTEFGKWGGDDKKTFIWAPSVKALIFDEAHRAKSHKTQSHRLVTAAKSQGIPALALSATLAENPLDLKAVGYLLGLHQLRNFWAWTRSYGCKPSPFGGFEFVGPDKPGILKRLHGEIFPRKGARLKKSALADFPETSIHTSLCPVADADEINQAYADIEAALDTVAERELTDKEHHLTVRLRARQKIELQKLPYIIDRTQDLVADGNSVCIFLNFSDSIKTVADALRAENVEVSVVEGGQTAEERERNIEAFQSDRVRVIIVNIQAGGVGVSLHDLNGQFPRHSLISPNDSARLIIQVFGRVHRAGGKTKSTQELLFAAGTVEEAIAARCEEKIVRIDAFNDGDLRQAA